MPHSENISLIIDQICKKHGINYSSCNPHYVELKEDIEKMSKFYLQLKQMLGILEEISERHDINGLKDKFKQLVDELSIADHDIIRLARELKNKLEDK